MSSYTLNGRIKSKNAGFGAVFTALVAFSLLAVSASAVWAQTAQDEIQAELVSQNPRLSARITILNATAAALAKATSTAIVTNTIPGLTPAEITIAALQPVDVTVRGNIVPEVRADRNTTAGLVAETAIAQLSGTDTSFASDAAAITDGMAEVNAPTTTQILTVAGKETVVKDALLAVSDAASSGLSTLTTAQLLAADKSIGTALTDDPALESLAVTARNPNGLLAILQVGIVGVDGARGTAQTVIPQAAADFVAGIVSTGTIPDNLVPDTFAVDILAPLKANTVADELEANALGAGTEYSSNLSGLADALYKSYPTAITKITQGITADVAESTGETTRNGFIDGLVTTNALKYSTLILEGAVFTDPYYAATFSGSVMTDVYESTTTTARGVIVDTGHTLLAADAPAIALGVGNILGQDGAVLTEVSSTFASFVESGALPAAKAAVYATDLISGAVNSKLPAIDFSDITPGSDGLTLDIGALVPRSTLRTGITTLSEEDLEAIGDYFANAIVAGSIATINTSKGAAAAAAEIGALGEDIARFTGNETDPSGKFVAAVLAASIADTVTAFDLTATVAEGRASDVVQTLILNTLEHDVELITNPTGDAFVTDAINAVVASNTNGQVFVSTNPNFNTTLTVPETAITNL
jgi:hypothetical protein